MRILFINGNYKNSAIFRSLSKKQDITVETFSQKNLDSFKKSISKKRQNKNFDVVFFNESQPLSIPKNLEKVNALKVAYFVDSHLHFYTWHKQFAKFFDVILCAQAKYIQKYRRLGLKNVYWLPLFFDPQVDNDLKFKRESDIGFVGTLNPIHNPQRSLLLWLLSKKFKLKIGQNTYGKDRAVIYSNSKIVINQSIYSCQNFRVYEAMACGAMLLTDKQDGLEKLFKNKKQLIIYRNFTDAIHLANLYINDNKKRAKIAETGHKEVLKNHSSKNRASTIIQIINKYKTARRVKTYQLNTSYILGRTHFFNYNFKAAKYHFEKHLKKGGSNIYAKIESIIYLLIIKLYPNFISKLSIILIRLTIRMLN